MKRIATCTAILCLFFNVGYSQQGSVRICGKVGPNVANILFKHFDLYMTRMDTDTLRLDAGGSFEHQWQLSGDNPRAILEIDTIQLDIYGQTNHDLSVEITQNRDSIHFSGSLARIHQYLQSAQSQWEKIYAEEMAKVPQFDSPGFVHSDRYFEFTDAVTRRRIAVLKAFFPKSPSPHVARFIEDETRSLIFHDLYYKSNYANVELAKFRILKDFLPSNGPYYAFTDSVDFDNPHLYQLRTFQRFAVTFFTQCGARKFILSNAGGTRQQFIDEAFSYIDLLSKETFCNTLLKVIFLNHELQNANTANIDLAIYGPYIERLPENESTFPLLSFIHDRLREGQASTHRFDKNGLSNIMLHDVKSNEISLVSFNDKAMYINVWASWCAPCIRKLPQWNRLVDLHKDNKKVRFLLASIDDNPSNWLKAMQRYQPRGVNLIASGGHDGPLADQFQITSIPRSILIDAGLSIVDLYAPGPADIDLAPLLR